MKYIVNAVFNEIKNNISNADEESLFLINGFEDLNIYLQVAQKLSEYANSCNKTITIKLAKNKWEYFKVKNQGQPCIPAMLQNGWVLENESTTEYRNKHSSDILILMGTETEDDLSGSLKEISRIESSELDRLLPLYDGKVDYSDIYIFGGMHISDRERKVINKLYKDLFDLINKDLCKLSNICDETIDKIDDINMFIELFFETLPKWGLPKKSIKLPTVAQLTSKSNKNLLRGQFNFINGTTFKSIASAYKKYSNRLNEYNQESNKYIDDWEGWQEQSIKNYSEFKQTILDFIEGDRSEDIKNKLLNFDFSIIEDVLEFKPVTETKEKKTKLKLYGNPYNAFYKAYLYALNYIKQNEEYSDGVHFEFTNIELVTVAEDNASSVVDVDNELDPNLIKAWKNLCIHTNGILEEINQQNFTVNDGFVALSYAPRNLFNVTSTPDIIVTRANSNKKLNKVSFIIKDEYSNKKICDVEWSFSPADKWLFDFKSICESKFVQVENYPYIPLVTSDKLRSLVLKKSEEEFYDYLDEKVDLNFDFDLIEWLENKDDLIYQNSGLQTPFSHLGLAFSQFCRNVYLNGLINTLNSDYSTNLIEAYNNLAEAILKKRFNENEYYIVDAFIHAFNIEETTDSVECLKDIELCIVPPWHPAAIEKIKYQNNFFVQGCYEFWNEVEKNDKSNDVSDKNIDDRIEELQELSVFQNVVDVFPISNSRLFGSNNSYGRFSLYTVPNLNKEENLRDLIKKEAVFDDEFNSSTYAHMSENSYMIYDVLKSYIKAFPSSRDKLSLVFIDPSDLQPVVASIQKYILEFQKKFGEEQELNLTLSILVRPENKGGKNYITYWMNESFDVDSKVKIKTYINEWDNKEELNKLINGNNDIIFVMDLLEVNDYDFINKIDHYNPSVNECYYPIVLRSGPISRTTTKRKVELTQPQFNVATNHTQVVRYKKNLEQVNNDIFYVVKTVDVNQEMKEIVKDLHTKSYWIVCIDTSIDGKLLQDVNSDNEYSVIGFSTGKGKYGQYNLTITARKTILKSIETNFSKRLSKMFKWPKDIVIQAARKCMNEVASLDGISVLTASNQKDYNVNEFMAYVLTSFRENEKGDNNPLKIIVHLDSYKHWFDEKSDITNMFDENSSNSRPDFLLLTISNDFEQKLRINATVIECKIANLINKNTHVEKALGQVHKGIKNLSEIFNPNSKSIKRRYWYAQLYRALTFAQISFNNSSVEFVRLSNKLRGILNGDFEITFDGAILGYWLDMDDNSETVVDLEENIKLYNIPQQRIQELILGKEDVEFVKIVEDFTSDQDEYSKSLEEKRKNLQKIIDSTKYFDSNNRYIANDIKPKIIKKDPINNDTSLINEISQNNVVDLNKTDLEKNNNNSISNVNDNEKISDDIYDLEKNKCDLEDIRVLIGQNRQKNDIYWEFGNPSQANRHMLITGTSGQGKTYSIQTMLYELSKESISSVVFDYTEGFTSNQLEQQFIDKMNSKIKQHVVKLQGVPINPFKKHTLDVAGFEMSESAADVANRFSHILAHVYKFGEQQVSAIFEATRIGIEKYGDKMNMRYFQDELRNIRSENKAADTVLSKMGPFFYSVEFTQSGEQFDWSEILYSKEGLTTIFQLTMIDREMQVIITELLLWDAWYYATKYGTKDKPFVVVLDEAQNLSHKSNSPSAKILTEGRKFGWSAWFATQSLKVLNEDEVIRLLQSSFKLYFKPTDTEVVKMAAQLDSYDKNAWISQLKALKKGECIVVGDRIRNDGTFGATRPTITTITSFENRN